jgi:hypothetical protein
MLHIHTTPTHLHTKHTHEDILSIQRVFTNVHQYGSISVNKNDFCTFRGFLPDAGPWWTETCSRIIVWICDTTLLLWRLKITFLVLCQCLAYVFSNGRISDGMVIYGHLLRQSEKPHEIPQPIYLVFRPGFELRTTRVRVWTVTTKIGSLVRVSRNKSATRYSH